ncbi:MAG: hypothetical protein ACPGU1_21300 [Myxococcota bacterium]
MTRRNTRLTPSVEGAACCTMTDPCTSEDAAPFCMTTDETQCLQPEALPWFDASFIWGPELERVNTVNCHLTVP